MVKWSHTRLVVSFCILSSNYIQNECIGEIYKSKLSTKKLKLYLNWKADLKFIMNSVMARV